jgi:tetratricopeptide (TPR) repeat protein
MKIAVYAISKNEAHFVKRFCASAKDADLIVIADTGSTDDTIQLAMNAGARVFEICVKPWRFDKARDAALALLPPDIDICISLDLDEVLEPGWRKEIERVWATDTTRLRYKFDWSNGVVFYSEKIHHRYGYHWHHPIHEYIRADNRIPEVYAHTDMLLVSHHPDETKSRSQYLPLLELAVKEDPYCHRNAFYYARELTFYSQWREAIPALKKYLTMPQASWSHERCYAMRLLGKSHESLGEIKEAEKWYQGACLEEPNTREPWVDYAMFCYNTNDWETCYFAATRALKIKEKLEVYTMDPAAWSDKPHDLCSIAAWHLGHKDKARQELDEALKFKPEDPRLLANKEWMK